MKKEELKKMLIELIETDEDVRRAIYNGSKTYRSDFLSKTGLFLLGIK